MLKGSRFILRLHPQLTSDGIRQMASRLGLSEDLLEFTALVDVAEEAGVSRQAVLQWVTHQGYRRHCRLWGHTFLIPLPVIRLYLSGRRTARRPRGWWGTARTAEHLGVSTETVRKMVARGEVDAVQHGQTFFIDPHSLTPTRRAPANDVPVVTLAALLEIRHDTLHRRLRRAGYAPQVYTLPGGGRAAYLNAGHARRFLSERGYHEELVEVYLRRAVMAGSKPKQTPHSQAPLEVP